MIQTGATTYEDVRKYYNYKVDSYEQKYRSGDITHLHAGLFKPELSIPTKLDLLQHELVKGQQLLTDTVIARIPMTAGSILDLGAGHGGTSITIAKERNVQVTALTISDRQADLIDQRIQSLSLESKINVICENILTHNFGKQKFDAIIGIESFCQIDNFERLISLVSKLLNPNGCLIVSDYYSEDMEFKSKFDKHWVCDVKPFDHLAINLQKNELQILERLDYTLDQAPFWKLSAAHSKIRLTQNPSESEMKRLTTSHEFHQFMHQAFLNKRGQYVIFKSVK